MKPKRGGKNEHISGVAQENFDLKKLGLNSQISHAVNIFTRNSLFFKISWGKTGSKAYIKELLRKTAEIFFYYDPMIELH